MEVCRLCLDYTLLPIDQATPNYALYQTQFKLLLPEINIGLTPKYILCDRCSDSLEASFAFRNKCIHTEELINNYLKVSNKLPVNLNLLKLKLNNDIVISQPMEVEENNIKCEPIDSQDEGRNEENIFLRDSITITVTFVCDNCQLDFQDEDTFRKHSESCKASYEYKIPYVNVGETYSGNIPVEYPIEPEKNIEGEFACEICNKTCSSKTKLEKHLLSHSIDTASVTIKKENEENENVVLLNDTITFRFICGHCNLTCRDEDEFNEHNKTCGTMPESKEDELLAILRTEDFEADSHITEWSEFQPYEKDEKGFICESFNKEECSLETTVEETISCIICKKTFSNLHQLQLHKKTHGEEKYKCSLCSKGLTSEANLKRHMAAMHRKRHYCKTCNHMYYSEATLKEHVCLHRNKEAEYNCTICKKVFKGRKWLRKHMARHTKVMGAISE